MRVLAASFLFGTLVLWLPESAKATDDNLAVELGTVLASESFCDLSFDQSAIQRFIEDRVSSDDMNFISELKTMSDGASFENGRMSTSEKTARCTQVRRVATKFGFLK